MFHKESIVTVYNMLVHFRPLKPKMQLSHKYSMNFYQIFRIYNEINNEAINNEII